MPNESTTVREARRSRSTTVKLSDEAFRTARALAQEGFRNLSQQIEYMVRTHPDVARGDSDVR